MQLSNAANTVGPACEDVVYNGAVASLEDIVTNNRLSPEDRLQQLAQSAKKVTEMRDGVTHICQIALLFILAVAYHMYRNDTGSNCAEDTWDMLCATFFPNETQVLGYTLGKKGPLRKLCIYISNTGADLRKKVFGAICAIPHFSLSKAEEAILREKTAAGVARASTKRKRGADGTGKGEVAGGAGVCVGNGKGKGHKQPSGRTVCNEPTDIAPSAAVPAAAPARSRGKTNMSRVLHLKMTGRFSCRRSFLKRKMTGASRYHCIRHYSTSAAGLKILVYEALRY
jgi:hypothetical protein